MQWMHVMGNSAKPEWHKVNSFHFLFLYVLSACVATGNKILYEALFFCRCVSLKLIRNAIAGFYFQFATAHTKLVWFVWMKSKVEKIVFILRRDNVSAWSVLLFTRDASWQTGLCIYKLLRLNQNKKHRADRLKTWYYRKFDAAVSRITRFRLIILTQMLPLWTAVQFSRSSRSALIMTKDLFTKYLTHFSRKQNCVTFSSSSSVFFN